MDQNGKQEAPGKWFRKGISLNEAVHMFPDDAAAERWFALLRWPHGPVCPHCRSANVQSACAHPCAPYRCRSCRKRFSSMKLSRELGITQKSAWHLGHRLRTGFARPAGPVEVDEIYIGGKGRNKHASTKLNAGRRTVDKKPVVGARDRASGEVHARPVAGTIQQELQGFVKVQASPGAAVHTDTCSSYASLEGFAHDTVNHSAGQDMRGTVHTNSIQSFRALFKRGLYGTHHHRSGQHLQRSLAEFTGRHNVRDLDMAEQMGWLAVGLNGRRLPWKMLSGSVRLPAAACLNGAESGTGFTHSTPRAESCAGSAANRSGNTLRHACAMSGLEHTRSANGALQI